MLTAEERQADIDTLGGLVVAQAGYLPARGEIIAHGSGYEFEVLDADPRRLKRLRVRAPKPASAGRLGQAALHDATDTAGGLRRLAARIAALAGWRRVGLAGPAWRRWRPRRCRRCTSCRCCSSPSPACSGWSRALRASAGAAPAGPSSAGWWFGLGHFATGLYWIAHALLVDAAKFGWLIPPVVLGLAALLALFVGAATAALHLSRLRGIAGVLVLAVAWTAGEWVRGHLFTGFPWNLTGSAWAGLLPMMQPASLVGLYGLSLLTVAIAAMPATLATPSQGARRWTGTAAAAAVLAALWVGGDHPARRRSGHGAGRAPAPGPARYPAKPEMGPGPARAAPGPHDAADPSAGLRAASRT